MIWEVFRQEQRGKYHTHCGNVHAPDKEMALMFAQIQHGRRRPTHSLWVTPRDEIGEVDAEETRFGGTTDKSYRWASTFNTDEDFAAEIAASQREQEAAERERAEQDGGAERGSDAEQGAEEGESA
ncbi:phenylacetic acid degradation protein PaaB [Halobacteriales archaeon QS_3_64_16]|nr:MAG: phenylacetic acid degradation protein PaaB [Halobacteriales archaeon QS_3_64_16]